MVSASCFTSVKVDRIAFLAIVFCVVLTADSAAGWGPRRVLYTHGDCVSETLDVARVEGTGWIALWDAANPRCATGTRRTYQLRTATSEDGRRWGDHHLLPDGFEIPALRTAGGDGLHVHKRDRVLVLGARPAAGREPSQLNRVLQLARLSADGLEWRHDLDGGRLLYGSDGDSGSGLPSDVDDARPVISLAPNGRGVAVWARLVDDDPDSPVGQVYARVRGKRGRFRAAKALGAPGQPSGLAVDVNDRGEAALAWCRDRADLMLRTRRPRQGWSDSERLGSCSDANEVDVTLDDRGRVAVAWAATRYEPHPNGIWRNEIAEGVRATVGTLENRVRVRTLSRDGRGAQVLLARDGTALVAWSGPYSGPTRGVRFARVGGRSVRSKGAITGKKGHELVDLAPDTRGRGVVLWGARGAAFFTRAIGRHGNVGRRELVFRVDPFEGTLVLEAANLGLDLAGPRAVAIWSHARTDSRATPTRSTVEAAVLDAGAMLR